MVREGSSGVVVAATYHQTAQDQRRLQAPHLGATLTPALSLWEREQEGDRRPGSVRAAPLSRLGGEGAGGGVHMKNTPSTIYSSRTTGKKCQRHIMVIAGISHGSKRSFKLDSF